MIKVAATSLPTVASSAENFKNELETYFKQPSPEREKFVFNSILKFVTKNQLQNNMKAIQVDGPDNKTYKVKVMPDYVMIGSTRVPMSGLTAQTVAKHFGMKLPDAHMTRIIHEKADVQVAAKPLSGTGVTIDGKKYNQKQVVESGVGNASFVKEYNERINRELAEKNVKPGEIVSGFAKDIVDLPGNLGDKYLGLYGFWGKDNVPIQGGLQGTGKSVHDNKYHSEYGAFARLWDPDNVEVIDKATGKSEKISGEEFKKAVQKVKVNITPKKEDKAVAKAPASPQTTTPAKPTTPSVPATPPTQVAKLAPKPAPKPSPTSPSPESQKIDEFFREFASNTFDRRFNIIKRAADLLKHF